MKQRTSDHDAWATARRAGRKAGRLAAAGVTVALVVASAACTAAPEPPRPSPTRTAVSLAPSAQPDPSITWTSLRGPFALYEQVHDVDGDRHLVETVDDGVVTLVRHGADGEEERLPLGKDEILQEAYLTVQGAVFSVTNDVERTAAAAIRWWPNRAAEADDLWGWPDTQTVSRIAVVDSMATYTVSMVTSTVPKVPDSTCLITSDLSVDDPSEHKGASNCSEPGHVLEPSTDGTTLAWTDQDRGPGAQECATLIRLTGGEAERVDVDGCVARGTASATLAAWSELPEPDSEGGQDYQRARTKAAHGSTTVDLGLGEYGSAVICDDTVLWVTDSGEAPELRSWRPGAEPTAIYRAPQDDAAGSDGPYDIYGPTCLGGSSVGFHLTSGSSDLTKEFLVGSLS